ncbi:MAG: glycosyltransferase involved in cell wall biosynthesis [Sulfurimonas sp.]|jgi:glycosyltransferase involved in cell wall biosynthesis|uniref:glycosyltransferase n=1 Tax=Sulfurimonas sp. TaxID=2022749 RepID=UPI0039E4EBF9
MKRLKLAYVSPLPPLKSGISYYSEELLKQLSLYYNIDVVISNDALEDVAKSINYQIKSVPYFKINHTLYDRVIYHVGNSPFHEYMLDLLNEVLGVVVLHDFYISNLIDFSQKLEPNLLYLLHGYQASKDSTGTDSLKNIILKYPANKYVLNNALGVIVHSGYSKTLVNNYYYKPNTDNWFTIPHLRESPHKKDLFSREDLGMPQDAFVVCSFGMLGANKQNEKLFDAWMNTSLSSNDNCYLIFVGENDAAAYGKELDKSINLQKNIKITGWTDVVTFDSYLSISDIAVQLRSNSRGETSGTVLDTMNNAIPTIVNANGSMMELPKDAVYMIQDNFNTTELAEALEKLYKDKSLREVLAKKAAEYIRTYHNPVHCAQRYYEAIENSYDETKSYKQKAIKKLSEKIQDMPQLVELLSLSDFDSIAQRQILVDISSIIKCDLKTGIQRVVRSQIIELIKNAPDNYRIEPVYLNSNELVYSYARSYTAELLKLESLNIYDEPISVNDGDIFYGLDLCTFEVNESSKAKIYESYKTLGVNIKFVVYDLLPISHENFFLSNAKKIHTQWLDNITEIADELVCISGTVASEVRSWIQDYKPFKQNTLKVSVLHLGADIISTEKIIHKKIKKSPNFLMVGTIEPRKGHVQVLQAFDILWKEGLDIHLTIVGKTGWMVDEFTKRLATHDELDNRFHFLGAIDDVALSEVYYLADCIIVASEAEGFGLPLIEAAQNALAIMARDIPVFREIANNYVYFFKNTNNAEDLAIDIKRWLSLYEKNEHPLSKDMPYLSWEQNARKLLEIF